MQIKEKSRDTNPSGRLYGLPFQEPRNVINNISNSFPFSFIYRTKVQYAWFSFLPVNDMHSSISRLRFLLADCQFLHHGLRSISINGKTLIIYKSFD